MIRHAILLLTLLSMLACSEPRPTYASFSDYPVYAGSDLGVNYTADQTTFRHWSPAAEAARLHLYSTDEPSEQAEKTIELEEISGAWTSTEVGDLVGKYYTLQIKYQGQWLAEATDPYAVAVGTNGLRGQVVDLSTTHPPGWEADKKPALAHPTDIVLYELHVRDASQHDNSGIQQKGKFLGLTELGTTNSDGLSTGLDHLVELGVTHVHLLPSFDFMSVDESRPDEAQFNWGYDPQNYNVPEGSYSTNPKDGAVRIREFKQLIKALHDKGLRVVMDVVYNHTGRTADSHFNLLTPGYYYRQNEDGSFSDASACGNEIASERPMVRQYILASVKYWVEEYHIDGFRFDLMGIHDIATMNDISNSLHDIDSTIFLYGEGWTAGDSPLPLEKRALKAHVPKLKGIAAFSDDIRDGMKGSVFHHKEIGFVNGKSGLAQTMRFGIVAATQHPQVDYEAVNYSKAPWALQPSQCINYASCHDNHTLWDRLAIGNPNKAAYQREAMHRLALAIVLTSQGVPFLHAGTEFLRTKGGEENSYKSPDSVNAIDWDRKTTYKTTYDYVRGLLALRKAHPAFRLRTQEDISRHLRFIDTEDELLVAYQITAAPQEEWTNILVVLNGSEGSKNFTLSSGKWQKVLDGKSADLAGIGQPISKQLRLEAHSAAVLYRLD